MCIAPPRHAHGDLTSLAPHERLPEILVPSRELAQTLASATSKQGLNREAWAALFRVRTGSECPEGNLRELT